MNFASLKASALNIKNKTVQAFVAPQDGKDVTLALAVACSAGVIAGTIAKVILNKTLGI